MADIDAYGVIREGFAHELKRAIAKVPEHEPIELHISSPGGLLCEGVTAYNLLRSARNEVIAYLEGDAFSAATLLVCAADKAEMPSNALLMIHEPYVPVVTPGTIGELETTAKYLRATLRNVVDIYSEKLSLGKRRVGELLKAETYYSAEQALEAGFVQNVTQPSRHIQNLALEEYEARDKTRLAAALGARPVLTNVTPIIDKLTKMLEDLKQCEKQRRNG